MRLREILPITAWLGSYSLKRLGPDGVAGLSLAAFVIPPVNQRHAVVALGCARAASPVTRKEPAWSRP